MWQAHLKLKLKLSQVNLSQVTHGRTYFRTNLFSRPEHTEQALLVSHVVVPPVEGKGGVDKPVEGVHANHGVHRAGQVLPLNIEGVQKE